MQDNKEANKVEATVVKEKEPEKKYVPYRATTNLDESKLGDQSSKQMGLKKKVDFIYEKLESISEPKKKGKKDKVFSLPGNVKRELKTAAMKDKLLVIFLKRNRTIKPVMAKIVNGFVEVDGMFYNCSLDFVFNWMGKYPAIVLPQWDLNPIGTEDYYDAVAGGRTPEPQKVIIRAIEASKITASGNKMSGKMMIWLGIAAIVVFYVLFAGGG